MTFEDRPRGRLQLRCRLQELPAGKGQKTGPDPPKVADKDWTLNHQIKRSNRQNCTLRWYTLHVWGEGVIICGSHRFHIFIPLKLKFFSEPEGEVALLLEGGVSHETVHFFPGLCGDIGFGIDEPGGGRQWAGHYDAGEGVCPLRPDPGQRHDEVSDGAGL